MSKGLTRRQVLTGAALAAGGAAVAGSRHLTALASITVGPRTKTLGCDTLVVVFLRGGADCLNIIAPYGDDQYYVHRPSLALPAPKAGAPSTESRLLRLDDFFGLHPAFGAVEPLFKEGQMGVVHAVGSGPNDGSHFEAMEAMERGLFTVEGGANSGWLAKHLVNTRTEGESPLRAVAFAHTLPDSLRGATSATSLISLTDYRLMGPYRPPTGKDNQEFHAETWAKQESRLKAVEHTLREMYGFSDKPEKSVAKNSDVLAVGGHASLDAMEAVRKLNPGNYQPAPGAKYPEGELGDGFRQAACLIKGEVGLEVACIDKGGWDTHVAQGRDNGWQPMLLKELGEAIAAFNADLGKWMNRVTVVVMTEFGRRVYENTGLGTDHGRASCMMLFGNNISGGKVHGKWPGLKPEQLEDPGDLKVTTDYRDILAELVAKRLKNPDVANIFPGHTAKFHNIVKG